MTSFCSRKQGTINLCLIHLTTKKKIEINVDVFVTMITMENLNNMTCLFVEKK